MRQRKLRFNKTFSFTGWHENKHQWFVCSTQQEVNWRVVKVSIDIIKRHDVLMLYILSLIYHQIIKVFPFTVMSIVQFSSNSNLLFLHDVTFENFPSGKLIIDKPPISLNSNHINFPMIANENFSKYLQTFSYLRLFVFVSVCRWVG